MALIFGSLKCCFCEGKMGLFHSVHSYGIYAYDMGKRIFYHPECLEIVEMDPEKYGHKMIDLAIEISDRRKENIKQTNSKIIQEHKEKIETLHRNNFERMMPSKS